MFRRVLITMLCLAIAFLGVAGAHIHVPDAGPEHAHEAQTSGHAHAITVFDSDHDAEHSQHGDIDVEPMAKAFGKVLLDQLTPAVALLYVMAVLLVGTAETLISPRPLRRPPKRLFPHFLPPSQAPPATASLR